MLNAVQNFPTVVALMLAGLFALAAVLNLFAPTFLISAYTRWNFPPAFNRIIALFSALAAGFLSMPITRLWGVALAGVIMFTTEALLLSREKYAYAIPGFLVIAALVPASLAAPF